MTVFSGFMVCWFGTILVAFAMQGAYGKQIARLGLVSPVPVAFLWPFGLIALIAAAPFAASYYLGKFTLGRVLDR